MSICSFIICVYYSWLSFFSASFSHSPLFFTIGIQRVYLPKLHGTTKHVDNTNNNCIKK